MQNFEATLDNCSYNDLKAPGAPFPDSFLFSILNVSDPLITETSDGLHV